MSGISSRWRNKHGNIGPGTLIGRSPFCFPLEDSSLIKSPSYDLLLRRDQMVRILRNHSSVRAFLSNVQPQIKSKGGDDDFDLRDTATIMIHRDVKITLLFRIARITTATSFWGGKTQWWKFRFIVIAGVVNRQFEEVRPLYEQFLQRNANEWTPQREQCITAEDEDKESIGEGEE